ncbi:MAG TPA: family 20 glycosylhydrolase, partial [Gemmatimonadaceae bacterium]
MSSSASASRTSRLPCGSELTRSWVGVALVALSLVVRTGEAQTPIPPPIAHDADTYDWQAILPRPVNIVPPAPFEGQFRLVSSMSIAVPDSKRMREIAQLLADEIRARTGLTTRLSTRLPASITIDTTLHLNGLRVQNPEAYALRVSPQGITINASSPEGALRAVQTLIQLVPRDSIGVMLAMRVDDRPRFRWRGSMLDVSRHFLPVAAVKKHIDLIARYKLNVLHWHLTDDQGWRIEIKKYSKLTSVGA